MAANKITAYYGADVSEVEAGMLKATRLNKAYENAVKQTAKAEAAQASGGLIGRLSAGAPKVLGNVKALSGALGQAAAAAGLVPGLGVAAIGVAAVVAGVNKIKEYYAEAAKSAEDIADAMARAGKRDFDARVAGMSEDQKLKFQREITKEAEDQWHIGVQAGLNDLEILRRREEYDIARIELAKMEREAAKKTADEKKSASARESQRAEEESKQKRDNLQRNQDIKDEQDKADKEAFEKAKEASKKLADEEGKRLEELARDKYNNAWRYASLEQRIAQAQKEGRAAQRAAEKDGNSKNLLALAAARNKYRDLIDEQRALNEQKAKGVAIDTGRNADGNFTTKSGRVKVSDADRARSEITRAVTARRSAEATSKQVRSRGSDEAFAGGAGVSTANASEKTLKEIAGYLKPKS